MRQREKMIELLDSMTKRTYSNKVVEGFADYLIDNGVVVMPCKVGDVVYTKNHHGRVVDGKVESIHENLSLLGRGGFVYTVYYPEYYGSCESGLSPDFLPYRGIYRIEDFGETVFLTSEEAKAAFIGDE